MALEGGSLGFQIGGQATDLVLLVMNSGGAKSILESKVKLGRDASAAAGPLRRGWGHGRIHASEDPQLLARAVCSLESHSKAPRCAPMTTQRRTSMGAQQRQNKSGCA